MESLYILELAGGKYYVGKSADVAKRYQQHKTGNGSAWTKQYEPIKLLETRPITSPYDETNVTKELMKKHGIHNVRGGAYTAVILPEEQEDAIRHELRSAHDTCYKCGKSGHFANQCTRKSSFTATCQCGRKFLAVDELMSHIRMCIAREQVEAPPTTGVCFRCGRTGHYEPDCYARTHTRGHSLEEESSSEDDDTCFRCGRTGHYSADCYARRHIKGYPI